MNRATLYHSLIAGIGKIYYRVSLSVLHKRMDGYHENANRPIKHYANDIEQPLRECVDEIIINKKPGMAASESIYSSLHLITVSQHIPEKYNVEELYVMNRKNIGDLSKYFKSKNNGSILATGIEEKLEQSTWEHIHAVVRYARQGNNKDAQMHASIASTACKELAHFMAEESYSGFVNDIEKYLLALRTADSDY